MAAQQEIEFKATDGLMLRGLYLPSAEAKAAAIILTPGLNFPVNELYINVARYFQRPEYVVLLYDPRGVGRSDGEPRGDINPALQIADLHDAVTFIKGRKGVDLHHIALCGYSLSGAEVISMRFNAPCI